MLDLPSSILSGTIQKSTTNSSFLLRLEDRDATAHQFSNTHAHNGFNNYFAAPSSNLFHRSDLTPLATRLQYQSRRHETTIPTQEENHRYTASRHCPSNRVRTRPNNHSRRWKYKRPLRRSSRRRLWLGRLRRSILDQRLHMGRSSRTFHTIHHPRTHRNWPIHFTNEHRSPTAFTSPTTSPPRTSPPPRPSTTPSSAASSSAAPSSSAPSGQSSRAN